MSDFNSLPLNSNIHKALASCGYKEPTPVQEKAIPPILEGKDVVVTAQTGTGKTAAFVLPALNRLSLQPPSKKTRVLILTPTRELATQVTKAALLYGKYLQFRIISLVGGMSYHTQIKDLSRGADIIVATPGRLLDHIEQKRADLSHVEMLVLDEADRMLDMGFIDDVKYIVQLMSSQRQTLLFSATMDKQLLAVIKHLQKNPVRIDLSTEMVSAPQIKQTMYKTQSPAAKTKLLKQLLHEESVYKAIIFTATKIYADKLAHALEDEGFAAAAIHGDLRQNVRNRTLDQFRHGKTQFLVATDVAARGIDVSDVTHVINYDLPRFCEDYVHRIGRTGRAGKTGIAISFVSPSDMKHLQRIERYTNQRIKLLSMDRDDSSGGDAGDKSGQPHKKTKPVAQTEESFQRRKPRSDHNSEDNFQHRRAQPSRRSEDGFERRKPRSPHQAEDGFERRKPRSPHQAEDGFERRKPRSPHQAEDGFERRKPRSPHQAEDGFERRKPRSPHQAEDRFERRKARSPHQAEDGFERRKARSPHQAEDGFERRKPRSPHQAEDRFERRKPRSPHQAEDGFAHRKAKPKYHSEDDFRHKKPKREHDEEYKPFKKKYHQDKPATADAHHATDGNQRPKKPQHALGSKKVKNESRFERKPDNKKPGKRGSDASFRPFKKKFKSK